MHVGRLSLVVGVLVALGCAGEPTPPTDVDRDGVPASADCDDNDPDSTIVAEDADCDGSPTTVDCDDADPAVGAVVVPMEPLFTGDFTVVYDGWADYSSGDLVPVVVDEVVPLSFRILSTNNPYISNPNTSYLRVTIDPVDGTATVTSNECLNYGPGFCVDVTGTGTVTCAADVDLLLDYGSFSGHALQLTRP